MKAVDLETVEAIDRLADRIDASHASLGHRIDTAQSFLADCIGVVESSLSDRIDAVEGSLGHRIDALQTLTEAEVADLRKGITGLHTALHEGLDENRRYALMLNESTRHDVQLVAEGVAALAVKIDSLHR